MPVEFQHAGQACRVAAGGWYPGPDEGRPVYRDTAAETQRAIVARIRAGAPWRAAVAEVLADRQPWLCRVVTSPLRARFLELCPPPAGARVLDIGAGWGQLTLPLAERGHAVCALEPTPERMDFIRAAAEQEGSAGRIHFVQADYLDLAMATRFDVILCIGVLEWVGRFSRAGETDARAAQQRFLEQARRDLAPGGRLVIGIENRLGLKYWLGAPDDHLGRPHIMLFDRQLAAARWREATGEDLRVLVYDMEEYRELLRAAGFSRLAFHAALPDYKLPEVILPADTAADLAAYFLSGGFVAEHSGLDGALLAPDRQAELQSLYRTLAHLGIVHHFAPSYYIEAQP